MVEGCKFTIRATEFTFRSNISVNLITFHGLVFGVRQGATVSTFCHFLHLLVYAVLVLGELGPVTTRLCSARVIALEHQVEWLIQAPLPLLAISSVNTISPSPPLYIETSGSHGSGFSTADITHFRYALSTFILLGPCWEERGYIILVCTKTNVRPY